MRRWVLLLIGLAAAWAAGRAAVAGDAPSAGMSRAAAYARVTVLRDVGERLFADPALSASGKLACATCHDPAHDFGPVDAEPVQKGGADMRQPGVRAVPSLRYLQAVPAFAEHFYQGEDEGDPSVDNGPTGGLTWDGRVDRARDQARVPLLSPFEMANASPDAVVAALRRSPNAAAFRAAFGPGALDDDKTAFALIREALEAHQQDHALFFPYSSKYDAYLAGRAHLSEAEARGLAAFDDPARGNCAHCHFSARDPDGGAPHFTDYGFIALGLPRNRDIPANHDLNYYDLGLCGPLRSDFRGRAEYCGLFRAPSLRNTARRKVFFHNGVFQTLEQVLDFYAERDTSPGKFYPRAADGTVDKYDDLPPAYRGNVNVEPPFGGHPGETPQLSPQDRADIIAFLRTLDDGWEAK